MLVDEVEIYIEAGKGGDGKVAFEKAAMELGPAGGSGGEGGNVYAKGVADIGALRKFHSRERLRASEGKDGLAGNKDGAKGEDLFLDVPVGTVVWDSEKGEMIAEVTKIGEEVLVARGGKGGRGNTHFKSSKNTSPKEFEFGEKGESLHILFELKLIADVGLVGLPNVGKSNLLKELTNAKTKVANYPFTTLEPSLGVYYDLIIADLPGLIEGASSGKGLGTKFLRHIERTGVLFHLVAADSKDPLKDYRTLRDELEKYEEELLKKPEYLIISRSDEVSEEGLSRVKEKMATMNERVHELSILKDDTVEDIRRVLDRLMEEKTAKEQD